MLPIHLINHILQQNPQVCQQLIGYNGIVIAIQTGSLKIIGRINQHGLLDATPKSPDTTLILHEDALSNVLQGKLPNFNDFAIEGNVELGIGIFMRCTQIRYTLKQDLCHIFGEDTVERIAQKTEKIGKILHILGKTLMFQAATIAPSSREQQLSEQLAACTDALHQVQQQLAQANRRLDEIERKMQIDDVASKHA